MNMAFGLVEGTIAAEPPALGYTQFVGQSTLRTCIWLP